ncbi:hypothetical protein [Conchiformibius steedae]|uniref:hypothetical protein n=1 Tax=Conchiformibius steedae TaxID=153493 RepID=UPI0026ED5471|nr:hypothetical protein [Conchiformibius steedae]
MTTTQLDFEGVLVRYLHDDTSKNKLAGILGVNVLFDRRHAPTKNGITGAVGIQSGLGEYARRFTVSGNRWQQWQDGQLAAQGEGVESFLHYIHPNPDLRLQHHNAYTVFLNSTLHSNTPPDRIPDKLFIKPIRQTLHELTPYFQSLPDHDTARLGSITDTLALWHQQGLVRSEPMPYGIQLNGFNLTHDDLAAFRDDPLRLVQTVQYHLHDHFLLPEQVEKLKMTALQAAHQQHRVVVTETTTDAAPLVPQNTGQNGPAAYTDTIKPFPKDYPIPLFDGKYPTAADPWQFISRLKRAAQSDAFNQAFTWDRERQGISYQLDGESGFFQAHDTSTVSWRGQEYGIMPFLFFALAHIKGEAAADALFWSAWEDAATDTLLRQMDKNDLLMMLDKHHGFFDTLPKDFSPQLEQRYTGKDFVVVVNTRQDGQGQHQTWRVYKGGYEPEDARHTSTLDLFRTMTGIVPFGEAKRAMLSLLTDTDYRPEQRQQSAVMPKSAYQKAQALNRVLPDRAEEKTHHLYHDYFVRQRGMPEYAYRELSETGRLYNGVLTLEKKGANIPVLVFRPDDNLENYVNVRSIHRELDGRPLSKERAVNQSLVFSESGETHTFSLPISRYAQSIYQTPVQQSIAFVEAPIDAVSYQALFPTDCVITQNGVHGSKQLQASLRSYFTMAFARPDIAAQQLPRLIYACDNTATPQSHPAAYAALTESVESVYDHASDKELNGKILPRLYRHCQEHCRNSPAYTQLFGQDGQCATWDKLHALLTQHHGGTLPFSQAAVQQAQQAFVRESSRTDRSTFPVGAALTELYLVQNGLFQIRTPFVPEYGIHKDWNALLVSAKNQERRAAPKMSDAQLHSLIAQKTADHFPHAALYATAAYEKNIGRPFAWHKPTPIPAGDSLLPPPGLVQSPSR